MFEKWEIWQIALTSVFGSVWLVYFILDTRRKIAAKKRRKQRIQQLRRDGYSDVQIEEYLNDPRNNLRA